MNLTEAREHVNDLLSDLRATKTVVSEDTSFLKTSKKQLTYIKQAQEITQLVAQTIQQQVHQHITGVVNRSLETVFVGKDRYGFKIDFERKRGKTEANLLLTKNGHEIDDPLNSDSGGVCEVAALALRLSCIAMSKPYLRKILILDEPFKSVSEEYLENVRLLLEGLAGDFGVQFVIVTHIPALETGKVIRLK